jgi:hypothetical protein
MAGLQIKTEILLANDKFERQLRQSQKQIQGFGKSVKTISNAVKAAWVGVATLGFNVLTDAITDAAKAAAEDKRSMALLNEQMRRTWHGNEALNKSIDQQIDTMSNMTGIADDKLRPALIRIAAVTKNPRKGMSMLGLATDIAAKSGSDLVLVSKNMAKFLGGNKTALDKLVPGLSRAGDRMAFLEKNYRGFAEISGANDPFARIQIILQNIQEKIGSAFLPLFQKLADYLSSEEGQAALQEIVDKFTQLGDWFASPEGKEALSQWMTDLEALIKLAGDFLGLVGETAALLDSSGKDRKAGNPAPASNIYTGSTVKTTGLGDAGVVNQLHNIVYGAIKDIKLDPVSSMKAVPLGGGVTVNVDVKSDPITGKSIVKVLKQEASTRGTTVGKVLG